MGSAPEDSRFVAGGRQRITDHEIRRLLQRPVPPIPTHTEDRNEMPLPSSHDHRLRQALRGHRLLPRYQIHRRHVGQGKFYGFMRDRSLKKTLYVLDRSPGIVAMGGGSCEGRGFKFQHHILGGHFFT